MKSKAPYTHLHILNSNSYTGLLTIWVNGLYVDHYATWTDALFHAKSYLPSHTLTDLEIIDANGEICASISDFCAPRPTLWSWKKRKAPLGRRAA
jgi:hypothetical protein